MSHRRMEHEKSKQNIAFVVYCVSSQPDDKYGELQIPGKKELGHKRGGKQAFKQIKMNYGTKKRSCFLGFQSLSRERICVKIFFIWQDIRFRFGPREYIYINKNWSLFGTPVEYDCGYFCVSQDMCALDWAPEQQELCGEKPVVESQHEKPLDSAASKLHLARLNHKYKKKTK